MKRDNTRKREREKDREREREREREKKTHLNSGRPPTSPREMKVGVER